MTYPEQLALAWAAAQAPRLADAPTVISTFAGCGGSSLGYAMAGYRELLAVEWDDNAVATFARNFPDVPVYHGDIAQLSVEQVLAMTGLQPGELDVFDGSPPCQGFSTAGKRQMADPRNSLFREYVRLLVGLQPKVFVMENVSGMVKGKMKLIFVEILQELKAAGYQVSARLLNAMYFGVPQSRERMIFIGVRNDLGIAPSHPAAQTRPVTVREAIGLDGFVEYRANNSPGAVNIKRKSFDSPSPALMRVESPMMRHWVAAGTVTALSQDMPAPQLSARYQGYWSAAAQGKPVGKLNSNKKLVPDKPSHSLVKAEGYGGAYHPTECRALSLGERKRLASFPDAFQFLDWASGVERIGNSEPPLFMRAIAAHLRTAILDQVRTQVAA
jgi:DNA (cytosine-5)-methyltransferase 1